MKLLSDPIACDPVHTFDLEIGGESASHSYQIVPGYISKPNAIVTHNTVSLLAGSTPGVHFPISRCYIRRVRLSKDSDLIPALMAAGFAVEPAVGSEKSTVVVEFPIKLDEGVRSQYDVTMWEKLHLTALVQQYWADNQVSVTIDFDREKEGNDIARAIDYFQYNLKSVSFLPRSDDANTTYPQMPYEAISEEKCDEMLSKIRPIAFPRRAASAGAPEDKIEKDIFCDSDKCVVVDNHRGKSSVDATSSKTDKRPGENNINSASKKQDKKN